jgi:hypothetical protein
MALSDKQRQKKAERKNKKRKLGKKSSWIAQHLGSRAFSYAGYPLHECLVPSGLFETGIGTVIAARKVPGGNLALSAFVVDVYCLGVKNALFNIVNEVDYERSIKYRLMESHEGQHFDRTHVACTKKLIEGAVAYAEGLGFAPHSDYRSAKGIFDAVDALSCPVKYVYGQNGKPFYIQGPHESLAQAKRIVEKLRLVCGEGGYHYLVSVG